MTEQSVGLVGCSASNFVGSANAQGQQFLVRLENKHGKGKALTILAHKLARAVYYMLTRGTVFEMDMFLNGYGSRAGKPAA
jgi:hypothetical protein